MTSMSTKSGIEMIATRLTPNRSRNLPTKGRAAASPSELISDARLISPRPQPNSACSGTTIVPRM